MKRCCRCKEFKEYSEFNKNASSKDGVAYICRKCLSDYHTEHYYANRDSLIAYQKRYAEDHKEKVAERKREWMRNRRKTSPQYKMLVKIRRMLLNFIEGNATDGWMSERIGCSFVAFRKHIEDGFKPGMSWANRGRWGWHLHHHIPLTSVDLLDDEQLSKVCHYTNISPVWEKDHNKLHSDRRNYCEGPT